MNVQSALEEHLKQKVTLGSDIRLIMVRVDAGIECTVSMITGGTKEMTSYFVAFDEAESGTPIYRLEIMSDKIIDKSCAWWSIHELHGSHRAITVQNYGERHRE